MSKSPMLDLLRAGNWGEFQPQFDALTQWSHYPLLTAALENLNHEALFVSHMHGLGHIERTMLQGAFCAMAEGLNEEDTQLLLECCSYHDVGRVNDWVDDLHGHRSAGRLAELTGRTGEELLLLQGAVDAHSRRDKELEATIDGYAAADRRRAIMLAQLLKDSDGLDRVRLGDLDPKYLRRDASRLRAGLAREVFRRYQRHIGRADRPRFTEEEVAAFRARNEQPGMPPKVKISLTSCIDAENQV